MRRFIPRSRLIAVAAGASLLTAGALGAAAISAPKGADGVIYACYNQAQLTSDGSGELVLVEAGAACPAGWPQPLSWNAAGAPGAKGDTGPKGETGAPGEQRASGLPKEKSATVLKQIKVDEGKAKKIDDDMAKLRDQLGNLDPTDERDLLKLQVLMEKWARATEQTAEILRKQAQTQKEIVQGIK